MDNKQVEEMIEDSLTEASSDVDKLRGMTKNLIENYKVAKDYISFGISIDSDDELNDAYTELATLVEAVDMGIQDVSKMNIRSFRV